MWVVVVCKSRNGILVSRERRGWTLYMFWVAQFDVKGTIMCHNVKFAKFCSACGWHSQWSGQAKHVVGSEGRRVIAEPRNLDRRGGGWPGGRQRLAKR